MIKIPFRVLLRYVVNIDSQDELPPHGLSGNAEARGVRRTYGRVLSS